jgi:hypothetical protein
MGIVSIRNRVERLERTGLYDPVVEYPPLSHAEIEALAVRARAGARFDHKEVKRLEFLSPIVEGEFVITANRGQVFAKRYVGVDAAEI